jgi:acyl dehydratase
MANPRTIAYADLESLAGQEVGVSDWHTIDQNRVNLFAEATGDHQWIHVDVERATKLMGGPIAHGFLTLSLLPMLGAEVLRVDGVTRGINYGSDKVRFTNMVPVGSKVRLRQKCLSVEAKSGGKQMKMEATVEIEGKQRVEGHHPGQRRLPRVAEQVLHLICSRAAAPWPRCVRATAIGLHRRASARPSGRR